MAKHYCDKEIEIGIMTEKINNIEKDVKEVKGILKDLPKYMEERYASKKDLEIIKKIVYWLLGVSGSIIGMSVVWIIQRLLIKGGL